MTTPRWRVGARTRLPAIFGRADRVLIGMVHLLPLPRLSRL